MTQTYIHIIMNDILDGTKEFTKPIHQWEIDTIRPLINELNKRKGEANNLVSYFEMTDDGQCIYESEKDFPEGCREAISYFNGSILDDKYPFDRIENIDIWEVEVKENNEF